MIELGKWYDFKFRGTWSALKYWHTVEIERLREKLQMEIAWKLPVWLVHWCVVRAMLLVEMQHRGQMPDSVTGYQMMHVTAPEWWQRYRREQEQKNAD